jgi:NAD(P)H-dependent flavin oxidoreductase YrpB (nitropropane dioxygenase family)
MRTAFTELVGMPHPIVGFNRSPGVVAAVGDAKFLAAASTDTVRSPARTGKPARQLRGAWHDEWEQPGSPAPLPMPLQPMLVNEAWRRIDAAAKSGHEGALRLESFFVGQVVGSFEQLRPAGEITRQIVADCERRIAELAGLVP